MNDSPKLTDAQKANIPAIGPQGVLVSHKDAEPFYIYGPWMDGMQGVLVYHLEDVTEPGLFYVFSACSEKFIGSARVAR